MLQLMQSQTASAGEPTSGVSKMGLSFANDDTCLVLT